MTKNPPAKAGDVRDTGLIPGSGRSAREGNGNSLQYSCLGNPTDRGAWRAAVHGHDWRDLAHTISKVLWGWHCDFWGQVIKGIQLPPSSLSLCLPATQLWGGPGHTEGGHPWTTAQPWSHQKPISTANVRVRALQTFLSCPSCHHKVEQNRGSCCFSLQVSEWFAVH